MTFVASGTVTATSMITSVRTGASRSPLITPICAGVTHKPSTEDVLISLEVMVKGVTTSGETSSGTSTTSSVAYKTESVVITF
jgi:hypothetical protein